MDCQEIFQRCLLRACNELTKYQNDIDDFKSMANMMKFDAEKCFPRQMRKFEKQLRNREKLISQTLEMGRKLWEHRGRIAHKNMACEGTKRKVEEVVNELKSMVNEEFILSYWNVLQLLLT